MTTCARSDVSGVKRCVRHHSLARSALERRDLTRFQRLLIRTLNPIRQQTSKRAIKRTNTENSERQKPDTLSISLSTDAGFLQEEWRSLIKTEGLIGAKPQIILEGGFGGSGGCADDVRMLDLIKRHTFAPERWLGGSDVASSNVLMQTHWLAWCRKVENNCNERMKANKTKHAPKTDTCPHRKPTMHQTWTQYNPLTVKYKHPRTKQNSQTRFPIILWHPKTKALKLKLTSWVGAGASIRHKRRRWRSEFQLNQTLERINCEQ